MVYLAVEFEEKLAELDGLRGEIDGVVGVGRES